jgi:hypothetical protein
MVKLVIKQKLSKKKKQVKVTVRKNKSRTRKSPMAMGPVASISTAPVAIGNSIRGAALSSVRSRNSARIVGRDFCFTPIATASTITNWCMVGGTPLTPAAFVDSKIRSYLQLYQKFRWIRCAVHYITSSPTSSTGDVMFYHAKIRNSVFLNQTSNLLLPFVMSDPDTVLGPQWTNHSALLTVDGDWKSTDYGMDANPNDYAEGEVYLLSKTSTTDSPGYVLMDYEIEFAEEQVNPRLLTLPISRIQWSQLNVGRTSFSMTKGNQFLALTTGNNLGGTASVIPTGCVLGDIYKVILDVTNSSPSAWTGVDATNVLQLVAGPTTTNTVTLTDGFTCYAVYGGASTGFQFYPSIDAAFVSGTGYFQYGITVTAVFNLQIWLSYVGQIGTNNFISNY